jgi:hypothetical protein
MSKNSILKKTRAVYLDGTDFLPAIPRSGDNSQLSLIIPTNSNEVSRVSITSASVKNVRFEDEPDIQIADTLSEEYYTLNFTTNKNLINNNRAILESHMAKAYYKNKSLPMKEYGLFGNVDLELNAATTTPTPFSNAKQPQVFYAPTPVLGRYQRNSARLTQALRSSKKIF